MTIFDSRLDELLGHVAGIRDGDEDAVHHGRVATRRLGEALVLVSPDFEEDERAQISETLRRARRALGTARDIDVLQNLLRGLDRRYPLGLSATAALRTVLHRERQKGLRRLVKEIERLDLAGLRAHVARARPGVRLRVRSATAWRQRLREHVGARSSMVRAAVYHAGGIYFPNRSHSARVAIKKLRYTLELVEALGPGHPARAIRRLKRVQDTLGEAHDRQAAIARFGSLNAQESGVAAHDVDSVVRVLEAEIVELHRKYSERRDEVLAICDECDGFVTRGHAGRVLIAAGVVLPSILMFVRGSSTEDSSRRDEVSEKRDDVRVKISVS